MPWIALGLLILACLVGGGVGGWMLANHLRPLLGYVVGGAGVAVGAAMVVMGGMSHGMEGVAYAIPGVLLVLPAGIGVVLGTAIAARR